ncbi:hypothetical protein [Streptomyces sp. NPDC055105]|uniref:hypothetical protein n=1 Tax=Streptomyces sp. NPDC055105 TaxID=3365719 RepID=UPI0037D5A286
MTRRRATHVPKQPNSVLFIPDQLHADMLGIEAPHHHLRPQPPPRAASLGKASHVRVHRKATPLEEEPQMASAGFCTT